MKEQPAVDLKQISLESLKELKKNEYIKLFKKPITWKKKKGIIFILKYDFKPGKLPIVAIPIRRYTEAQKIFKSQVKGTYASKLILLGELNMYKQEDGNVVAEVTPKMGGADVEVAAAKLFAKMKVLFKLVGDKTTEQEQEEQKIDPDQLARLEKKKRRRLARYAKIGENLSKIESLFNKELGDDLSSKLLNKIAMMEEAYQDMEIEAMEDGNIDQEEQDNLDKLQAQLTELKKTAGLEVEEAPRDLELEEDKEDIESTEPKLEETPPLSNEEIKAQFETYVQAFQKAMEQLQSL